MATILPNSKIADNIKYFIPKLIKWKNTSANIFLKHEVKNPSATNQPNSRICSLVSVFHIRDHLSFAKSIVKWLRTKLHHWNFDIYLPYLSYLQLSEKTKKYFLVLKIGFSIVEKTPLQRSYLFNIQLPIISKFNPKNKSSISTKDIFQKYSKNFQNPAGDL